MNKFLGLKNILEQFVELVFPSFCISCKEALYQNERFLCTICRNNLPITDYHLDNENDLKKKFYKRVNLEYALSYLKFNRKTVVQSIIHHLKYKKLKELGEIMGNWYGHLLFQYGFEKKLDLILPIPLHSSRQKERGYNQSNYFAKGLSNILKVPHSDQVLIRKHFNKSQTKIQRYARWMNVKDIFSVRDEKALHTKNILLVDDVITTGATIESCAQVIEKCKVRSISIAAIAAVCEI